MSFRPTLWKTIGSVLAIALVWLYFAVQAYSVLCATCPRPLGICEPFPSLLPQACNCGCGVSLGVFIKELTILLLPAILVYVVWSLVQKK